MKNRSILLLSGLLTGLAFSVLLVRLTSLERENARQREQIAVMRETATQAREAFDRMQPVPLPCLMSVPIPKFISKASRSANKDLDAEIETLEIVSKEK